MVKQPIFFYISDYYVYIQKAITLMRCHHIIHKPILGGLFGPTITHKIFEANSNFHVK